MTGFHVTQSGPSTGSCVPSTRRPEYGRPTDVAWCHSTFASSDARASSCSTGFGTRRSGAGTALRESRGARGRAGTSGSGDPPGAGRRPARRRRAGARRSAASWPTRGRAPPPAPCASRGAASAPPAPPAVAAVRPRAPSRPGCERDGSSPSRAKRRHRQRERREWLPRLLAEPEHVRVEPHLVAPPAHGRDVLR